MRIKHLCLALFTIILTFCFFQDKKDFVCFTKTEINLNESVIVLNNRKITEIPIYKNNAQYSLARYSKYDHSIYYSRKSCFEPTDQIWKYDLQNCNHQQLTYDFYAINDIFDTGDYLVISGILKSDNSHRVRLYKYNKKTQLLSLASDTIDAVNYVSYHIYNREFLVISYDYGEYMNRINNQDNTPFYFPEQKIYLVSNDEEKLVCTLKENMCVSSAVFNDTYILLRIYSVDYDSNHLLDYYDINMDRKGFMISNNEVFDKIKYVYMNNNNDIYVIEETEMFYQIKEIKTGTVLYSVEKTKACINNGA